MSKIIIDADDAAFGLKKVVVGHLKSKGIEVEDLNYNAIRLMLPTRKWAIIWPERCRQKRSTGPS